MLVEFRFVYVNPIFIGWPRQIDQIMYVSNYESLSVRVCMYVLQISRETFPRFHWRVCIAGNPRTCSVKFGAIWARDTFNINKLSINNRRNLFFSVCFSVCLYSMCVWLFFFLSLENCSSDRFPIWQVYSWGPKGVQCRECCKQHFQEPSNWPTPNWHPFQTGMRSKPVCPANGQATKRALP